MKKIIITALFSILTFQGCAFTTFMYNRAYERQDIRIICNQAYIWDETEWVVFREVYQTALSKNPINRTHRENYYIEMGNRFYK